MTKSKELQTTSETKEVMVTPSQELIDQARANMPTAEGFQRIQLPRLGMYSQDKTEGKGKAMKVIAEAGQFYIEKETDELNEDGKKVWVKEEIGTSFEGTVAFYRKQLSMYDSATEKYTNSPIYDNDEEEIPLFCDKKEVMRGTPKHLKQVYAYTGEDGKKKSKLQDNKVLYVLYNGEAYQMSIKGTSMYSFLTYTRSVVPPVVHTLFSSEEKSSGATTWNMMTFKTIRELSADEVEKVIELQNQIKFSIKAEKDYYASLNTDVVEDQDWAPDAPKVAVLGDGQTF